MRAGKYNKRVSIKRLTKSSDGYGGTTSTMTTQSVVWAHLKEINGGIDLENGRQKRMIEIELVFRKKTASQINDNDVLEVSHLDGNFRINNRFDNVIDFETTIKASKVG